MEKEMWKNALNNIDEKYIKEAEKLMDEPKSVDSLSILHPEKETRKKGTGNFLFVISAMAAALACVIGVGIVLGGKGEDIKVSPAATTDIVAKDANASEMSTTHTIIEEEGAAPLIPELVFIDEFDENKIKNYAFLNNKKLESYTVPDGITVIGKGAFADCTNLKSVYLSESVKIIEESAFQNCNALTEIIIPSDVYYIGERAFENCISLTSVTIPDGIDEISASLFKGCKSLEEISLPQGVTKIGDEGFYGCESLKRAELSDNLNEIASAAFYNCRSLEEIILPESLKLMGLSVFGNCKSLKEITIPSQMKYINNETFINCSSLSSVTIGENVTDIGAGAFENCVSLERISADDVFFIPYGLKTIGENAFKDCKNLWLVLPDSVTSIGEGAFSGCEKLDGTFKGINSSLTVPEYGLTLETRNDVLAVADNISVIPAGAYSGRVDIKEAVIPDSVSVIEDEAFYDCPNLERVTFLGSPTEIGARAFSRCEKLTEIVIPEGVKIIGEEAFAHCDKLETAVLPSTLSEIGEQLFFMCTLLSDITITDGVDYIGERMFKGCYNLKCVVLPESIRFINIEGFRGCGKLMEINIPEDIEFVDNTAFESCEELTVSYKGDSYSYDMLSEFYSHFHETLEGRNGDGLSFMLQCYPCDKFYSVTSYFGYSEFFEKGHDGIDISWEGCFGADIYAAHAGTVKEVKTEYEPNYDYGKYVILTNGGGYETLYAHCDEILVEVGDVVQAGDVIAKIGSTGWSTGPHLHFGLSHGGVSVNPLEYYTDRKAIINAVKSEYKGDNGFKLRAPVANPDAITEFYFEDGGYEGHTGIDYAWDNCFGSDIFAAGDGTVVYSDWFTNYGLCVIIDHGNGIATIYAHCSEVNVEKGDTVSLGDTIAKIGKTGMNTGEHLHFEVIINGFSQNPLRYME